LGRIGRHFLPGKVPQAVSAAQAVIRQKRGLKSCLSSVQIIRAFRIADSGRQSAAFSIVIASDLQLCGCQASGQLSCGHGGTSSERSP
jgi:hypothetical protein